MHLLCIVVGLCRFEFARERTEDADRTARVATTIRRPRAIPLRCRANPDDAIPRRRGECSSDCTRSLLPPLAPRWTSFEDDLIFRATARLIMRESEIRSRTTRGGVWGERLRESVCPSLAADKYKTMKINAPASFSSLSPSVLSLGPGRRHRANVSANRREGCPFGPDFGTTRFYDGLTSISA